MIRRLCFAFLLSIAALPAAGQQAVIPDYDTSRDEYFWRQFYVFGGETVYCGIPFGAYRVIVKEPDWPSMFLTVEHAYPADWIATKYGCTDRNHCPVPAFHLAAADLHNLWPAINRINSSRGDQAYGENLAAAETRFDFCPAFHRTYDVPQPEVEPRPAVRGDLARSILYMIDAYDLPDHGMRDMLLRWHRTDPPGAYELWRNYVIEHIEGVRNPYIDGKALQDPG